MKRIYDLEQYNAQQKETNKNVKSYKTWEQKMLDKGYRYEKALYEPVPTYIFASPRRQAEIAILNEKYLKKIEKKRKEANHAI